jgi:hypothetical protein
MLAHARQPAHPREVRRLLKRSGLQILQVRGSEPVQITGGKVDELTIRKCDHLETLI